MAESQNPGCRISRPHSLRDSRGRPARSSAWGHPARFSRRSEVRPRIKDPGAAGTGAPPTIALPGFHGRGIPGRPVQLPRPRRLPERISGKVLSLSARWRMPSFTLTGALMFPTSSAMHFSHAKPVPLSTQTRRSSDQCESRPPATRARLSERLSSEIQTIPVGTTEPRRRCPIQPA